MSAGDVGPLRAPSLIEIPPGTRREYCKGCNAPMWYVGRQPVTIGSREAPGVFTYNGRSLNVPEALAPTDMTAGKGWNHFADCVKRARFHTNKPPKDAAKGTGADAPKTPSVVEMAAANAGSSGSLDPSAATAQASAEGVDVLAEQVARQRLAGETAGAPCSAPKCPGFAILGLLAGMPSARLALAPCEAHADEAVGLLMLRRSRVKTCPVTEFLENPKKPEWRKPFVERCVAIRKLADERGSMAAALEP